MSRRPTPAGLAFALALSLGSSAAVQAAPQAAPRPELYVLENVRLSADADPVKLVLSNGRIERVLAADAANPAGARAVDGAGGLALPAFVDACTHHGLETPVPVVDRDVPVPTGSDVRIDMRSASRRGVQPHFAAVDAIALEDKVTAGMREQGFATLCVAPNGHLLPGASAVVSARNAALRDTVLAPHAFQHAQLVPSGGGYPSTLMGCMAQLRQFFMDAEHHRALKAREAAGQPGPRAPFDRDLEAILPVLDGEATLFCHAESHRDIERWLGLAEDFGFRVAITGGREAWRLADRLAALDVPVVLTLDWEEEVDDPDAKAKKAAKKAAEKAAEAKEGEGEASEPEEQAEAVAEPVEAAPEEPLQEPGDEPAEETAEEPAEETAGDPAEAAAEADEDAEPDWDYTEPLEIRRERRRLWEETRDCAIALHEAGVRVAFGTGGGSSKQLVKRVRELVEAGLPADVALDGLTSRGAELLGMGDRLGAVEPGRIASLAVWTADPTDSDAKLAWLFVEGYPHEFEVELDEEGDGPDEGVDATGTWTISQEQMGQQTSSTAVLEMTEEGEVTGTLSSPNPMGEGSIETALEGRVSGNVLTLKGTLAFGEFEAGFTMRGELDGDELSGDTTIKGSFGEFEQSFTGTREPDGAGGDDEHLNRAELEDLHGHPHDAGHACDRIDEETR